MTPDISIILPIYNEADNIFPLYEELSAALDAIGKTYEVLAIDDGSRDATFERLSEVHAKDSRWRIVRFRRNFGQTAAFRAGFEHACAPILITMDADLQNSPADIPRFLEKLDEGFDIVSGWRVNRKGSFILRRLPSFLANRLISKSTGVALHDYGCSLKAYRADAVQHVGLYGELHRFIPAIASQYGARITEIEVTDRERQHHASKYGIGRTFRVVLDLLTVFFLLRYSAKPLHFFSLFGGAAGGVGVAICGYLSVMKLAFGHNIGDRPLLLLGAMLIILGAQFLAMGLVAELVMRGYYEGSGKRPYAIREILGTEDEHA